MTEIPADVMEAARKQAEAIIPRMCMTMDHSFGLQTPEQQSGLRLSMAQIAEHDVAPTIARAIMAERERCAKKVDQFATDWGVAYKTMTDQISEAIRAG
jgi:hypothetical protein